MYRLKCLGCGADWDDDGLMVVCPNDHEPALLRTAYGPAFKPDASRLGIARYREWLPIPAAGALSCPQPAVFRSEALCAAFGAPNLWLAFNGYWPQRGALLPTGTFKDLESAAILARFPAAHHTLVAASA